jgi:hypothetical protein
MAKKKTPETTPISTDNTVKRSTLNKRMGFVAPPKSMLLGTRLQPPRLDTGFRVYKVTDAVDPSDHDALLWQALTEMDEMLTLEIIAVQNVSTNDQGGTSREKMLATVYFCGDKTPRRKYIACFSPKLSQEFAAMLIGQQPQNLILRKCAVTEEIRLILQLIHGGLKLPVSVYTHCPEGCPTCGAI